MITAADKKDNYHHSYRHLYELKEAGSIPFNQHPNAASNREANKFMALPTKRNAPLKHNRHKGPAPAAIQGVWKAISWVAKRAAAPGAFNNSSVIRGSHNDTLGVDAPAHALDEFDAASAPRTSVACSSYRADDQRTWTRDVGDHSTSSNTLEHLDFEKALLPTIMETLKSLQKPVPSLPHRVPRRSLDDSRIRYTDPSPPDLDRIRASRGVAHDSSSSTEVRTTSLADAIVLSDLRASRSSRGGASTRGRSLDRLEKRGDSVDLFDGIDETEEESALDAFRIQMFRSLLPTPAQWTELDELRIHAGAPEKSDIGVDRLIRYYAHLLHMEEKFPFQTGKVLIDFFWFEAFFSERKVITTCIHYEKASVLYNIAALLCQMACTQRLWTKEGQRAAAIYFQKSAGVLYYIRDTLCQRINMRLEKSSDLSENTLTAAAQLMLSQAMECFVDKAHDEKVSSTVTSKIAAQTADFFEMTLASAKMDISIMGKHRFPKDWISQVTAKYYLYLAQAHFHAPLNLDTEQALGERVARLAVAKGYAELAVKASKENVSGVIYEIVKSHSDTITNAHTLADSANFEKHTQHTTIDSQLVTHLTRPNESLVNPVSFDVTCGGSGVGLMQRYPDMFAAISVGNKNGGGNDGLDVLVTVTREVIERGRVEMETCSGEISRTLEIISLRQSTLPSQVGGTSDNTGQEMQQQSSDVMPIQELMVENRKGAHEVFSSMRILESDEEIAKSSKLMDALERSHDWIDNNLHEAADVLEEISSDQMYRNHDLAAKVQEQRILLIQANEKTQSHRETLKQLRQIYTTEIVDLNPSEWTREKLCELLPCLNSSRSSIIPVSLSPSDIAAEHARMEVRKEISGVLDKLGMLKRACSEKMTEIVKFEEEIGLLKSSDPSMSKVLPARRLQLEVIDDSIVRIRQEKDRLITKVINLSEILSAKDEKRKEEETAFEIISSFKKAIENQKSFRETAAREITDCVELRQTSVHILAACLQLRGHGDDSKGFRGEVDPLLARIVPTLGGHQAASGLGSGVAHPIDSFTFDTNPKALVELLHAHHMKKASGVDPTLAHRSQTAVYTGESDTISDQAYHRLVESEQSRGQSILNLQSRSNSKQSSFGELTPLEATEVLRVIRARRGVEREARRLADVERRKREEEAISLGGGLAYKMMLEASRTVSASSLNLEMRHVEALGPRAPPRSRLTRKAQSSRTDFGANANLDEQYTALRMNQEALKAQHAAEQAALVAKQMGEQAAFMKGHQELHNQRIIQKGVAPAPRRPANQPVRFIGAQDAQPELGGAGMARQRGDQLNESQRGTNWSLNSMKTSLINLIKPLVPGSNTPQNDVKPFHTSDGNPFSGSNRIPSHTGVSYEMLQQQSPRQSFDEASFPRNPSSRRMGSPHRNFSTNSTKDAEFFDAEEPEYSLDDGITLEQRAEDQGYEEEVEEDLYDYLDQDPRFENRQQDFHRQRKTANVREITINLDRLGGEQDHVEVYRSSPRRRVTQEPPSDRQRVHYKPDSVAELEQTASSSTPPRKSELNSWVQEQHRISGMTRRMSSAPLRRSSGSSKFVLFDSPAQSSSDLEIGNRRVGIHQQSHLQSGPLKRPQQTTRRSSSNIIDSSDRAELQRQHATAQPVVMTVMSAATTSPDVHLAAQIKSQKTKNSASPKRKPVNIDALLEKHLPVSVKDQRQDSGLVMDDTGAKPGISSEKKISAVAMDARQNHYHHHYHHDMRRSSLGKTSSARKESGGSSSGSGSYPRASSSILVSSVVASMKLDNDAVVDHFGALSAVNRQ